MSELEHVTPAWHARAACLGMDPSLFMPERGEDVRAALAVCRECPVRQECLEFALERWEPGIWGGTTQRQRREMRRHARREAS